jgi:adenylate kinase family enzyme
LQLEEMLAADGKELTSVLDFAVDDAVLRERLSGRWIHPGSGRSYHATLAPPKVPFKDDVSATCTRGRAVVGLTLTGRVCLQITGEDLVQRADDKPEAVAKRLDSYKKQTAPVLDFYSYVEFDVVQTHGVHKAACLPACRARRKLSTINADQPIDRVWSDVKTVIARDSGNTARLQ